ncbi:MAG: Peptidase M23B [Candidatus Moranbacteria bacterium GW2011_GWE1_49_15]|nr:MAG: Peptidase M23B [Candidatus Moranbacteria bacterium GW2011_GWE2_47_10]KKW07084.1 MAG: Peptidase M23B [Candidatus Moranbacteria bacterium GW2011_GWE1_49_15]HBP01436.1 hypothetical protein [Candidatus Moranbacteria bacterium]
MKSIISMANKKKIFAMPIIAVLVLSVTVFSYSEAETIDELAGTGQDEETQKKIEELEEKAEKYREIIEVKQKQQESLSNQISIMNANIYQVETEISANKQKIEALNTDISRKQTEIRDKEETILSQKKLIADLLKVFYENQHQNILAVFLSSGKFDPFLSQKDQLAQTGDKIREILENVRSLKEKLEEEKKSLEGDRAKLTELHLDLQDKNQNLENNKTQKQILLTQTQGEEERYKKLLEKVEEQKLELLNIDELYLASGLSVDDFKKPPSSLNASLSWFYSQKDSSWANTTIGNSKSKLKDWGCAVAAVAMVFTKHKDAITPKTLAKEPIFSWDLIKWPSESLPSGKVEIDSHGFYHGNISWSAVEDAIEDGNPVIVYIKRTKGGGHYVVIHNKDKKSGDYVVHDPYFGPNLYLSTSRALVGSMGSSSSTVIDQMIIYE